MHTTHDWAFSDPPNVAVFTLRRILQRQQPILHVTHDAEDGSWQFLGWEDAKEKDLAVVGLSTIVQLDPSVRVLADLPLGWHAWRMTIEEDWQRELLV